ncbi:PA14 domain-containing protein [Hymenobacter sp. YC55]|uniref:PA14 domain-containing protein n=1 Tax=Hymenobacter sp. YC55 TaxID=3034019 RepID=UPI0023F7B7C9|nr:PA14 domain-containing protein [Hymenobacter sp. YC55]MDF7814260.1 PA14 domain-containing protein [Hymenobacter sp. YC55]
MRQILFRSILGLGILGEALVGSSFAAAPGPGQPGHIASGSAPLAVRTSAADPVQGAGTGLTAIYFSNGTLAGAPALKRIDAAIDFQWGPGSPGPGVPIDNFSVRWEGLLAAPTTGRYKFTVATTEGVRLWVNGKKVLDTWDGKKADPAGASANLAAGEKTSIKLEYYDEEGDARIQLQWVPPGQVAQTIPTGNLYPLGSSTGPDPAGGASAPAAAPTPAPVAKAPAKEKQPVAAKPAAPAKEPAVAKATKEAKPAKETKVAAAPATEAASEAKPAAASKPATPAAATPFVPGVYTLTARSDGKALEVLDQAQPNAAVNPSAELATNGLPQWSIESAGNGYYRIAVQGGRKVLEVLGSATSNGTPLSLWPFYSGNNQLWSVEPVDEGFYKITAKHSGKAITANTPEEGGLQQRRYANRPTQQWKLEAIKPVVLTPVAGRRTTPGVGANQLSVYPNPSNGVMQMAYELNIEQPIGWVLYNQRGVAVRVSDYRRQGPGAQHQTLDFRSLPPGDYFLNLTVGTVNTKHPVQIRRPSAEAPAPTATTPTE